MKKGYSDNKLINHTSILVLAGRLLLFAAILIFQSIGGFSPLEMWDVFYVLGPLSVLYAMAFSRFIFRFPYTVENVRVGKFAGGVTLFFSYSSVIIYLVVICINALYKSVLPFQDLLRILYVGELLNAVFIASYLSFLFEIRERVQTD